jgi:hypothetical protein
MKLILEPLAIAANVIQLSLYQLNQVLLTFACLVMQMQIISIKDPKPTCEDQEKIWLKNATDAILKSLEKR